MSVVVVNTYPPLGLCLASTGGPPSQEVVLPVPVFQDSTQNREASRSRLQVDTPTSVSSKEQSFILVLTKMLMRLAFWQNCSADGLRVTQGTQGSHFLL